MVGMSFSREALMAREKDFEGWPKNDARMPLNIELESLGPRVLEKARASRDDEEKDDEQMFSKLTVWVE
jgi:hypothetical protein